MQNAPTTAAQSAFQSTSIYREILEKALSDAMGNAAKERLAAATKIKKLQQEKASVTSKLKKAAGTLAESERTHIIQLAEGRAMLAQLDGRVRALEAELEKVRRESEEKLVHERDAWLIQTSEEKRQLAQSWVETSAAKDLSVAKDREATTSRIETTEKALADARHLIHHLEQTSEGLRQELSDAVEQKHKAEAATTSIQQSFSKYRRMVWVSFKLF